MPPAGTAGRLVLPVSFRSTARASPKFTVAVPAPATDVVTRFGVLFLYPAGWFTWVTVYAPAGRAANVYAPVSSVLVVSVPAGPATRTEMPARPVVSSGSIRPLAFLSMNTLPVTV